MATIKLRVRVSELTNVMTQFDEIKVYRSTDGQDGTYSELTGPSTRITLVADQTLYEYIDTAGDSSYWYRFAYFNSSTTTESTASTPIQGECADGLYCTLQDIRDEGFSSSTYSDSRVLVIISLASQTIDRVTGRWFEARELDILVDGNDSPSLCLDMPIISITSVAIDGTDVDLDGVLVYNRHITSNLTTPDDRNDPRITFADVYTDDLQRRLGTRIRWPSGFQNINVVGSFGYTDYDGTSTGKTPDGINLLCKLLVGRELALISDVDGRTEARNAWRVLQYKTADQSISYTRPGTTTLSRLAGNQLTGDQEIDELILYYRRPGSIALV
jgi:hypothetical protein